MNANNSTPNESMDRELRLIRLLKDVETFERMDCFPTGFNMFEAVGMVNQEIKHSNFLSFLLDPNKHHPFRDNFLRAFLQEAAQNIDDANFSPLSIALNDYSDIRVYREWSNPEFNKRKIDIVMVSERNREVFVIENKVFAAESENQLIDYKKSVDTFHGFDDMKKHFIFLTPDEEAPSEDSWTRVGYSFVVQEIERLARSESYSLGHGLEQVLKDYAALLRRYVVVDDSLIIECKRIYERHKDALDLIFKHGNIQSTAFSSAIRSFFNEHSDLVDYGMHPKRVAFLPKWLDEIIPKYDGINWHNQSRPIVMWFSDVDTKYQLLFEVGPLNDGGVHEPEVRANLVKALRNLFGYKKTSEVATDGKYSRFWTKTTAIALEGEKSGRSPDQALDFLWTSLQNELSKHQSKLKEIVRLLS